jgi:hypothetical protein
MAVDLVGDLTVHPQGQVSAPKVWDDGFKLLKAFRLCHGSNGSTSAVFAQLAWAYEGYHPEQLRLVAFGGVEPEVMAKSNTPATSVMSARITFSSDRSYKVNPGACQLFGLYYPPSMDSKLQITMRSTGVTVRGGDTNSPTTSRLDGGQSALNVRAVTH